MVSFWENGASEYLNPSSPPTLEALLFLPTTTSLGGLLYLGSDTLGRLPIGFAYLLCSNRLRYLRFGLYFPPYFWSLLWLLQRLI